MLRFCFVRLLTEHILVRALKVKFCQLDSNNDNGVSREEQEEALVALIEYRTHEVQHVVLNLFIFPLGKFCSNFF